ncbi:restriction endonuclease subunit S [Methanoplanus endosymbiosus]|uniref:Type I restriction modification DNA specificity domain-containing protein n=1 Tax=Methanoplanus endosymbiosus TaxID=33865 RepID=A0A9E7PPK7_9EURY|nr:hypothetical protein [Methanoplanus endosymbiosus]UUX92526.1 hypothetical protein L6E24_14520 [Methanoplanus endosymbiosus]
MQANQFSWITNIIWRIADDALRETYALLPSLQEQTKIVKFIEKSMGDINKAIDAEKHEIVLLTEYHTRLISDVVTGKLDVREAVAGLPEEMGETKIIPDDETLNYSDEELFGENIGLISDKVDT